MLGYISRRFAYMLVTLVLVSMVSFAIIQLPPGDYLSNVIIRLQNSGADVSEAEIRNLTRQYGLDRPLHLQYALWISSFVRGNLGWSFEWNATVNDLLRGRLGLTVLVTFSSLLLSYLIAIPLGVYSATHQYSIGDYVFTVLGFVGLAVPGFLVALIFMFVAFEVFGLSPGGLFSPELANAPWSAAKVVDLLKHLPIPLLIVGLAGTASLLRILRATLLDELQKKYVVTARAKGLEERRLLFKYPLRVAVNPLVSSVGFLLPSMVSGSTIIGIVMNLQIVGPLLLRALQTQDMYLAGSIINILCMLTVLGTFLSDMLLLAVDPRIQYEKRA
jgi:peptide/nickel transport system permease protein